MSEWFTVTYLPACEPPFFVVRVQTKEGALFGCNLWAHMSLVEEIFRSTEPLVQQLMYLNEGRLVRARSGLATLPFLTGQKQELVFEDVPAPFAIPDVPLEGMFYGTDQGFFFLPSQAPYDAEYRFKFLDALNRRRRSRPLN